MKIILKLITILLIGLLFISCTYNSDKMSEPLFSWKNVEFIKGNHIPIPPSQIKSNNIYSEGKTSYHPYYMFDNNELTGWLGYLNEDKGRVAILKFPQIERNFKLSYIQIKTGLNNKVDIKKNNPKNIEIQLYKLLNTEENKNKVDATNDDNTERENNNPVYKLELVGKINMILKDTDEWQLIKINSDIHINDFEFANIYIKETYKDTNITGISDIKFLAEDKSGSIQAGKYEYLYKDLQKWFNNTSESHLKIQEKYLEYFYNTYEHTYKESNLDNWYKSLVKRKKVKRINVPKFEKASELINFGDVPKEQKDYFTELEKSSRSHTTFDSTMSQIYLKPSRRLWYRDMFELYLKRPDFDEKILEELPVILPYLEVLGTDLIETKYNENIEKSSMVNLIFQYNGLTNFYDTYNNEEELFLIRRHDIYDKKSPIKYVLYYTKEITDFRRTREIDNSDPAMIFIYDKKNRLVKTYIKNFSNEEHHYIIWDENNKIEKVMVLELGDYGLKRIYKILADK